MPFCCSGFIIDATRVMKTKEQIENAIVAKYSEDVKGLNATKCEFIDAQLDIADSVLSVANAKKVEAAKEYDKVVTDYLLRTEIGNKQLFILQRALLDFAKSYEDMPFLVWVQKNHKLENIDDIHTDTTTRLVRFLNGLREDYLKGRMQANKEKEEKKAAKEAAKAKVMATDFAAFSEKEFAEMVAKMQADYSAAKAKEAAK